MEVKHQGVIILVCKWCHWKGEIIAGYDEALFGKWEQPQFVFDEAAKMPYWSPGQGPPDDWRKWAGVDMGGRAASSRKGVDIGGYHFDLEWTAEELELINKLRKELWDEFRRKGGIDLSGHR